MSDYNPNNADDLMVKYLKGETIEQPIYDLVRRWAMCMDMRKTGEPLICKIINYTPNLHIHGHDATSPIGRWSELKIETETDSTSLSGKASWQSTTDLRKLDKLREEDQELIQSGIDYKGRLVYILRKDINETRILGKLHERIIAKSKTPKTTHTQLGDDFEILYLNKDKLEKVKSRNKISLEFYQKLVDNDPHICVG